MSKALTALATLVAVVLAVSAGSAAAQAPAGAPEAAGAGQPFSLADFPEVSQEGRDGVRDLLRALKLLPPDGEFSLVEGRPVRPAAPEVTDTPDLFSTRVAESLQAAVNTQLDRYEAFESGGELCEMTCVTLAGLAEGFCVGWFEEPDMEFCLAATSAAGDLCAGGCAR